MKKLIGLFLMSFASIANAQVFSTPNQSGGEIVITSRPCVFKNKNYEHLREAYAWSPTSSKAEACWGVRDGTVVIIYLKEGDERVYPIESFKEKR